MDIVHGPDVEAFLLIQFIGLCRKKDDWNVTRGGNVLQSPADLIAVHARHRHIEQDKIGLLSAGGDGKGLLAVGSDLGSVRAFEYSRNDRNVGRGVVDDQDEVFCLWPALLALQMPSETQPK